MNFSDKIVCANPSDDKDCPPTSAPVKETLEIRLTRSTPIIVPVPYSSPALQEREASSTLLPIQKTSLSPSSPQSVETEKLSITASSPAESEIVEPGGSYSSSLLAATLYFDYWYYQMQSSIISIPKNTVQEDENSEK